VTPYAAAVEICGFGVSFLLLASGIWKAREPTATKEALATAGLPVGSMAVRVLAAVEVSVGAGLLLTGSWPWYAAAAILFFGFSGFVLQALVRGLPIRTCGCFGRADSPASRLHLVGTTLVASAMAVAAIGLAIAGSPVNQLQHPSPLVWLFGASVAVILYTFLDPLARLWGRIRVASSEPARPA
jgi:hypothetical protein